MPTGLPPDSCRAAADQAFKDGRFELAGVSFSALTQIWAAEAAQANRDWTSVQARVADCKDTISKDDLPVLTSLSTAVVALSNAVAQLTYKTVASEGAVTHAVSQAIYSLQKCTSVAAVQGETLR